MLKLVSVTLWPNMNVLFEFITDLRLMKLGQSTRELWACASKCSAVWGPSTRPMAVFITKFHKWWKLRKTLLKACSPLSIQFPFKTEATVLYSKIENRFQAPIHFTSQCNSARKKWEKWLLRPTKPMRTIVHSGCCSNNWYFFSSNFLWGDCSESFVISKILWNASELWW